MNTGGLCEHGTQENLRKLIKKSQSKRTVKTVEILANHIPPLLYDIVAPLQFCFKLEAQEI